MVSVVEYTVLLFENDRGIYFSLKKCTSGKSSYTPKRKGQGFFIGGYKPVLVLNAPPPPSLPSRKDLLVTDSALMALWDGGSRYS